MDDHHISEWVRITPKYYSRMPVLTFPFEKLPAIYIAQSTVLELPDEARVHAYQWCYLERRRRSGVTELNAASFSRARVDAMPNVIERLSKWVLFSRMRPATIYRHFNVLYRFLSWADAAEHERRYEQVLTDADLALQALKQHHTHLRQRLQAHQISDATASASDQSAIAILSEVHGHAFLDEIEPLSILRRGVIDAPRDDEVGQWMSTLQAIFDSAARLVVKVQ